jgi:hypothetical protein
MWVKTVNRRELIEIFQAERLRDSDARVGRDFEYIPTSALSLPAREEDLILVWHDDPREALSLPNLIVTPTEQRDFFAWALTYLNTLRPISAFVRIATYDVAERALRLLTTPSLRRRESACAGLILGEAATYIEGKRDLQDVSVRVCAGTYSYVMARALALAFAASDVDSLSNAWFDARTLTGQPVLSLGPSALRAPWQVVQGLEDGILDSRADTESAPLAVFQACANMYFKGQMEQRQWLELDSEVPMISRYASMMRGPREDRVSALERAASELGSSSPTNRVSLAFALGCLASQIAPGTMEHMSLLSPYNHAFPGILLWYGLCAGLQRRSSVDLYAGGLGRRIIREVVRNEAFLDRPSCDICLPELKVLQSKGNGSLDLRTNSGAQIEIELAPCVMGSFRWPPPSNRQESIRSGVSNEELQYLEVDIGNAIETLRKVGARLSALITGGTAQLAKRDRKSRRR